MNVAFATRLHCIQTFAEKTYYSPCSFVWPRLRYSRPFLATWDQFFAQLCTLDRDGFSFTWP